MSITVTDLTHVYSPGQPQEHTALDGISFHIPDGTFAGIIGHTGSGKSTLVQHLNGLLKPTSGQIIVDDVDITKAGADSRRVRQTIGLVFQYPENQLFETDVLKDVMVQFYKAYPLEIKDITSAIEKEVGQINV